MGHNKTHRQERRVLEVVGTPAQVLERHGVVVRGHRALCPFHPDCHPSLFLRTNRRGYPRWRCYAGCGGGDALLLEARLSNRPIKVVWAEGCAMGAPKA